MGASYIIAVVIVVVAAVIIITIIIIIIIIIIIKGYRPKAFVVLLISNTKYHTIT